jgi:hypothetical protein
VGGCVCVGGGDSDKNLFASANSIYPILMFFSNKLLSNIGMDLVT